MVLQRFFGAGILAFKYLLNSWLLCCDLHVLQYFVSTMSDKEPDTPRTQRIKVAKKEVEEASNYMKNNLLEYFKAMDAIQKKVFYILILF